MYCKNTTEYVMIEMGNDFHRSKRATETKERIDALMSKGKYGIYLWFYAVVAFILAFLGQTLLCGILLGFVIVAEKDEWLSKQVMQAFFLSLVSSVVSGVFSLIHYSTPSISSEILYGIHRIFYTGINVIESLVSILVLVLVIIALTKVTKGKDAGIPLLSKLADRAFHVVEKQVYPPQQYQQPQYQQPQYQQAPYQQQPQQQPPQYQQNVPPQQQPPQQ